MTINDKVSGMLLGLAVGDALGVPVEFMSREKIRRKPVDDMRGYGTHNQPPGTWSDDASLTFCLADALADGEADLPNRLAKNMVNWVKDGFWTPHGQVFDIGIGTSSAIRRLEQGIPPEQAGGRSEYDNGNGSLMRILPLVALLENKPIEDRFVWVQRISALTHGHLRSVMACFYYLELARQVWQGIDKHEAYRTTNATVCACWASLPDTTAEQPLFDRLLSNTLAGLPEDKITSDGYVLHTLEASVWCWLTTTTYAEAVLKAVNLGSDTDTTGAVTGGLAGLDYGLDAIPTRWVDSLARLDSINELAVRLARSPFLMS